MIADSTIWPPWATDMIRAERFARRAVVVAVSQLRRGRCGSPSGAGAARTAASPRPRARPAHQPPRRSRPTGTADATVHAVPRRLNDVAVVRLDRGAQQLVVAHQRGARRACTGCSCHKRVEPSMSVNRNVTVPAGNSATRPLPYPRHDPIALSQAPRTPARKASTHHPGLDRRRAARQINTRSGPPSAAAPSRAACSWSRYSSTSNAGSRQELTRKIDCVVVLAPGSNLPVGNLEAPRRVAT